MAPSRYPESDISVGMITNHFNACAKMVRFFDCSDKAKKGKNARKLSKILAFIAGNSIMKGNERSTQ